MIKQTNEISDPNYKDALIVVTKNTTTGANDNQFTVTRYWQNIFSNSIKSEHLFDLVSGPYDNIFVFDDYAIVLKDKKEIKAVFYDKYRGDLVPANLEVTIYDDLKNEEATFEAITYRDLSGRGNWQMTGAIKTPGAITLYNFEEAINYENWQGSMSRVDENVAYMISSS